MCEKPDMQQVRQQSIQVKDEESQIAKHCRQSSRRAEWCVPVSALTRQKENPCYNRHLTGSAEDLHCQVGSDNLHVCGALVPAVKLATARRAQVDFRLELPGSIDDKQHVVEQNELPEPTKEGTRYNQLYSLSHR